MVEPDVSSRTCSLCENYKAVFSGPEYVLCAMCICWLHNSIESLPSNRILELRIKIGLRLNLVTTLEAWATSKN